MNIIQTFHLGRYIQQYTSPNDNFEYRYPQHLLQNSSFQRLFIVSNRYHGFPNWILDANCLMVSCIKQVMISKEFICKLNNIVQ